MYKINAKNKYGKRVYLLIPLFIFYSSFCNADISAQHPINTPPGLIAELEKLIEEKKLPGIAIGIIDKDKKKFIGLGSVSYTDSTLPDINTRYEIGSISKVFTSLLAQTLVDDKQLRWHSIIANYIEGDFRSFEISQIQLKELATHRSGLTKLPKNRSIFRDWSDPYNGYTRNDLYAEMRDKQVGNFLSRLFGQAELDKSYNYSNLGAGLLGQIAADTLNTSYATALNNAVLQPLSMQCTDLSNEPPLAPGHASGEVVSNWHFQALAGAGGVRSCMQDMLIFAAATLAAFDNHSDEKKIASKLNSSKINKSITATIAVQTHEPDMALGWLISRAEDQDIWWHNGGTGGYTSILLIEPKTGRALILLANENLYKEITKIGFNTMRTW